MYFPYFHSFITYFILAISRSNFTQIQWSWTFFNSQDDELFKNVQDFRILIKYNRVIVKNLCEVFFCSPFTFSIPESKTPSKVIPIKSVLFRIFCCLQLNRKENYLWFSIWISLEYTFWVWVKCYYYSTWLDLNHNYNKCEKII